MVRREVQDFSKRPSDGFWMSLSGRLDTELGPPDTGTPAPPEGTGLPGTGLEHWLLQTLNINLITMITVGSLTLTVGILFFSNALGTSSTDSSNLADANTAIEQPKLVDTTFRSEDPLPDPVPSQKKSIAIPILSEDSVESVVLDEESPAALLNLEAEEPSPQREVNQNLDTSTIEENDATGPCGPEIKLGEKIDPFRSELSNLLIKNRRVTSGKYKIAIKYSDNSLSINDRTIEGPERQQYIDLMKSYQIRPCDRRLVQITDQYVAVGVIADDGFKGQIKGSLDLNELNAHSESLKFSGTANVGGRSNPGKDQILVLKNTDERPDFDRLLGRLKDYGFKVKSSSFNENDDLIDAIRIHLTHPNGLDWNMRTRNFDRLEFRVSVDKRGKATDLKYQLNEEPFEKVGLTGKVTVSRTF